MHWVSAISRDHNTIGALDEACAELQTGLEGDPLDLVLVFASQEHLFDLGRVLPRIEANFGNRVAVAGCSVQSAIGSHFELEDGPGLTLLGAHLPDVGIDIRHLGPGELPPLDGSPKPWRNILGVGPEQRPSFMVLSDPFSADTETLLQGIDYAFPRCTVVGGLASGAQGPGANALFHPGGITREGALVLVLTGDIRIDAVVAQGCRPIGVPVRVTESEGGLIEEIDSRPAGDFLQDLFSSLDEEDRLAAQNALQLGVVVDELREEIGPRDFLIRSIMGLHRDSGMIAIGTELRPGQTIQFHVRDAKTAAADLHHHLERHRASNDIAGVLQFSCLGRGRNFFRQEHHEVAAIQRALGPVPLGGFFCNGEIGPVGSATHLHGYTTVLGLIRPRGPGVAD